MKKTEDIRTGSVRQWHPWKDQPGVPLTPSFLSDGKIFTGSDHQEFQANTLDTLSTIIPQRGLYVICNDLLDEDEIPSVDTLIGLQCFTPYLSRTGGIPASRLKQKKQSGFLVPCKTWLWDGVPDRQLVRNIHDIFTLTGYQSSTPASLSEKVLRGTLPDKLHISRPSTALRKDILENNPGGRIDKARRGPDGRPILYRRAFEYDKNKAYCHFARRVPSPFASPVYRNRPCLDDALSYVCGYWKVEMIAHECQGVQPIQLDGRGPCEGEMFTCWVWAEELRACLSHGYTCHAILCGYGYREMSDFLVCWSDTLWDYYQKTAGNDHMQLMVKAMMVGLPGRFLRSPERYELKHYTQAVKGDIALPIKWKEGSRRTLSSWVSHPVPDMESTALSPQGSYIVAMMRNELYTLAKREELRGNALIRSYIDCMAFEYRVESMEIGTGLGEYKEKVFANVYAEENRFIGAPIDPFGWEDVPKMRAPGYTQDMKIVEWQRYNKLLEEVLQWG